MAEQRRVDPKTRRTIPVLTKPGLIIDERAEQSWLEFEKGFQFVEGQVFPETNDRPWRDVNGKNLFGRA